MKSAQENGNIMSYIPRFTLKEPVQGEKGISIHPSNFLKVESRPQGAEIEMVDHRRFIVNESPNEISEQIEMSIHSDLGPEQDGISLCVPVATGTWSELEPIIGRFEADRITFGLIPVANKKKAFHLWRVKFDDEGYCRGEHLMPKHVALDHHPLFCDFTHVWVCGVPVPSNE